MTSTSQPRERYFNANGKDARRAADLSTMAALEEFLGGHNMLLTCSEAERVRVTGGGHADVIVVRTSEEAITPEPSLDRKEQEIKWEGFGEVISLAPFLNMVVGRLRSSFQFDPHVGPNTLWCRVRFVKCQ